MRLQPLDAQTLSLLRYEATMLSYTGLYLMHRPLPTAPPDHSGIYVRSNASAATCAGTFSAEHLVQPSPSAPPALTDEVVMNALCESFLVHYRVLAEFLYAKNRSHPDQILITQFVDAPPVAKKTPIHQNLLLCHQRLAHLSSERVKLKNSYDWAKLYQEIMCVLIAFVKECHPPNSDDPATRHYLAILGLPPMLI